jgi:hypothetical protein
MTMSIEPKIVVRFSLVSKEESSKNSISEILKKLPDPRSVFLINEERILNDGQLNQETSIDYEFELSTYDIEDCNKEFVEYWQSFKNNLKTMTNINGYKLFLDYEVTVYDLHYPSFIFNPEFLSFLLGLGIEFSMYFYND